MPRKRRTGGPRLPAAHLYTTLAPFYDRLDGAARDYDADVRWLHKVFQTHKLHTVLDVACGTASHALRLGRLGYAVTAMDASSSMLRVARQKAKGTRVALRYVRGDYRTHRFALPFDAAICMYWTLGAQVTDKELHGALVNIRRCVRPGGLFVFDVENADGIKRDQLNRLFHDYVVQEGRSSLVRFNYSRLERDTILDWRAFYFWQQQDRLRMLHDAIKLRFFEVDALGQHLERAGFQLVGVWGGSGRPFDPTGPSIYGVAERLVGRAQQMHTSPSSRTRAAGIDDLEAPSVAALNTETES